MLDAVNAHIVYIAAGRRKVAAVQALSEDEEKAMTLTIKMLRTQGIDV